ncbi:MAG: hypothetical protein OES24_06345 [Acidimicrobiia bacterium]|nr:hypothetical protein [Acidimicrobiia bacterium]
MLVASVVGLVAAITGVIVAWRLLAGLDTATMDTLAVTVDALDSIADTIDVADGTVAATSEALTELQATLSTLAVSLDSGADVVADTGQLTETAAPALADATLTLRQMESIGERVDGFLAAVANIPFTPDFDPEGGLGPTFGRLADDLDPLDEELTAAARSLEAFEGSLGDLRTDVDALVVTIGDVNQELLAGEELLVRYREDVARAREVALSSQAGLNQDQTALRWLILVAGLAFALAQLVPLWLGVFLLTAPNDRSRDRADPTRPGRTP